MANGNDKFKLKTKEDLGNKNRTRDFSTVLPPNRSGASQTLLEAVNNELTEIAQSHSNTVTLIENTIDSVEVSFSVDAGIINRLGRELVAKKETAVSELIKNAYDADALNLRLIFIDAETDTGELRIEDDGSGMTLDNLINGFMRISSSDKATHPYSPLYRRRRAGQKGIGRFATQRLGHVLEIITQTAQESVAHKIIINWDDYKEGLDLSKIHNRLETLPKKQAQGTLINIKRLREQWDKSLITSIYKDVSDLIVPTFVFNKKSAVNNVSIMDEGVALKESSGDAEPGFNLSIERRSDSLSEIVADAQTQLFEKTVAVISGYVDENKNGFWSLQSNKLNINETNIAIGPEREKAAPYKFLKNVSLKTHYFFINSKLVPKTDESLLRKFFLNKGGIRIYRNGFKVRPYGEQGDDWLTLDLSSRRRLLLFPHSNDNFYGWVEVPNDLFEETSSREYLIEDDAFGELQDFARSVLITAASRIAAIRGKKVSSSQKDWTATNKLPNLVREMRSRLSQAISYAKAAVKEQDDETPEPFLLLLRTAEELDRDLARLRGTQEKLLEEQGMLRVLASLGLIIGEFTHEIKHTLGASSLLSKQLLKRLTPDTAEAQIAEDLKFNVERFKTYASYFGRAIADNVSRELAPRDLAQAVEDFVETVNYAAKNAGVTLTVNFASDDIFLTTPMHASELASILFNLYSNAQKAIVRAGTKGEMLISVNAFENVLLLDFCDNGDGIPAENSELIFEAFFTTTRTADVTDHEEELLQGAGLGLKIVKDILRSYQGDVYVESPPAGYATCLRCEIPRAEGEGTGD